MKLFLKISVYCIPLLFGLFFGLADPVFAQMAQPRAECAQLGNCEISDIVQQAVNFARFIMGLAGGLFLVIFVYGGGLYIMSFGRESWVQRGKKAMMEAAIGVVFVMGAWTIVSYTATSIGYTGGGAPVTGGGTSATKTDAKCEAKSSEGYQCIHLDKLATGQKREDFDCLQSHCLSDSSKDYLCCKPKVKQAKE